MILTSALENLETYLWIFWLVVAIITLVFELVTDELVSIWLFVGSLVALILSACKVDIAVQLIVFVAVSLLFMVGARPFLKKWLNRNETKTNSDSYIGRIALVLEEIKVGEKGLVKLDGIEWTAVSNEDIEKGAKVEILSIEGNKFIVKEHKQIETNVNYI